jgi:hexosaminidase
MKSLITGLLLGVATTALAGLPALIPVPQEMRARDGVFQLSPRTRIYTDAAARATGQFLASRLAPATGYQLKVSGKVRPDRESTLSDGILLTTNGADASHGDESYQLIVATNRVIIRAPAPAGLFYGVQTLLQLLPPEVFSNKVVSGADWTMPCVQIQDWPRFHWRGLMLDVSRHFFTKPEVEQVLDAMAEQKLNTFHWHLVDDQGWRIQIKKYPKLTSVGAWRAGVGFGLPTNSTTAYGPDGRYGGFYTQRDIREVVAYAAARHITIVPEIEMPGHSLAALASYPEFGTGDEHFTVPLSGGVNTGIYTPAKPQTFEFLDGVLTEVFQLFPGKYIHIGGDEVPREPWRNDPACQALMKQEGLTNEDQLQSWFTRRMETFINAHDRTLIGWSEILKGGLAQNAVVMDWIGGGKEAASAGHDVVMTPTAYCYLDHYQSTNRAAEPRAIGSFLALKKVYSLEPVPAGVPPELQSHILGAQGNLWAEYIPNLRHAEYMLFPRLTALAEVTWSAKSARDWDSFKLRLPAQARRLDAMGVNYRHVSVTDPDLDTIK